MSEYTYQPFQEFLTGLHGIGFITNSDLLRRIDEKDTRGIVVTAGPTSGVLSIQGKLKSLAHLMRMYGHPPRKGTHGIRGYRL
jgi:hypothetical protein